MKRLLVLFTLVCTPVFIACSDDADDDDDFAGQKDAGTTGPDAGPRDAATAADTSVASRGTQIENVGAACDSVSDCRGSGALSCMMDLFGTPLPNGYCTASCRADAECGAGGACPVARYANLPIVGAIVTQALPVTCLLRCDKSDPSSCRDGYSCASLVDVVGEFGSLLGPTGSEPYCMPPLPDGLTDGGMPRPGDGGVQPVGDGGFTSTDAAVGAGLDGGQVDGG